MIEGENLKNDQQMKILGFLFIQDLTPIPDLNKTIQICYATLNKMIKVKNYISPENRALFIKSTDLYI